VLRLHAAWALGSIGTEAARSALATALAGERHPDVRNEIEVALGETPLPQPGCSPPAGVSAAPHGPDHVQVIR